MPVFDETRNTVRQAIGRQTGRMLGTFAVTAATSGFVDTVDWAIRNADQGTGLGLYVYVGGGLGQSRPTHTSAVLSGTGARLYVQPAFTTIPSTNASFELWHGILAVDVNNWIDDAIRQAARRVLDHKEDTSIQLDDQLRHWGSFERWPDGIAAAPDGFTLNGTGAAVARESSLVYSGRYSAKLTNQVSQAAYLETDSIPNFAALAGKQATLKAKVYTTTASRVRISLLDGVNTWNSNYHDGNNGWNGDATNPLAIEAVTLALNPTQLKVQLRIESGAAISVYWGKVWLAVGDHIYEWDLPQSGSVETAFA